MRAAKAAGKSAAPCSGCVIVLTVTADVREGKGAWVQYFLRHRKSCDDCTARDPGIPDIMKANPDLLAECTTSDFRDKVVAYGAEVLADGMSPKGQEKRRKRAEDRKARKARKS